MEVGATLTLTRQVEDANIQETIFSYAGRDIEYRRVPLY